MFSMTLKICGNGLSTPMFRIFGELHPCPSLCSLCSTAQVLLARVTAPANPLIWGFVPCLSCQSLAFPPCPGYQCTSPLSFETQAKAQPLPLTHLTPLPSLFLLPLPLPLLQPPNPHPCLRPHNDLSHRNSLLWYLTWSKQASALLCPLREVER